MTKVFLGLGSNIGDRKKYLEQAIVEIKKLRDTKLIQYSSIFETEPWGYAEQDAYFNAVIEIETDIHFSELIKEVKEIEVKLGRDKTDKWKSRKIDIDILFYGNLVYEEDHLQIPHKQISERNFVLVPMNEIAPDFLHPALKKKISELTAATTDKLKVSLHSKLFEQ